MNIEIELIEIGPGEYLVLSDGDELGVVYVVYRHDDRWNAHSHDGEDIPMTASDPFSAAIQLAAWSDLRVGNAEVTS